VREQGSPMNIIDAEFGAVGPATPGMHEGVTGGKAQRSAIPWYQRGKSLP
jgi:hypothetical protein